MQVITINHGYLVTPIKPDTIAHFADSGSDTDHDDHSWGWPEYAYWLEEDAVVYPAILKRLANAGLVFGWEYVCTEDFSYFAYNFPTEESKNNLVYFKTGKRKNLPHLSKKNRKIYEDISIVNELLLRLGVPNGSS